MRAVTSIVAGLGFVLATQSPAGAQPDAGGARDHPLAFMFGEWAGPASGTAPGGERFAVTQTERVGPMLDGDVTVIEGRGYAGDGRVVFNAFAVISPGRNSGEWEIRSYSGGRAGTFPFELRADGYSWTVPAGPSGAVRYTAVFEGDEWRETGELVPAEGEPRQIFEMTLTRIGSTDWPAADPVTPPAR